MERKVTLSKAEIFVVIAMRLVRRISLRIWKIKAARVLVMCLLVIAFVQYVVFPIFGWWDGVVARLNNVIWG